MLHRREFLYSVSHCSCVRYKQFATRCKNKRAFLLFPHGDKLTATRRLYQHNFSTTVGIRSNSFLSLEFRYNRVANDFLGFVSMRINAPPISCEEAEIGAFEADVHGRLQQGVQSGRGIRTDLQFVALQEMIALKCATSSRR